MKIYYDSSLITGLGNSLFFEFTRGSDTLISFKTRAKFLTELADIWPIERYLDQIEEAMVVLQKLGSRQMSYTDFLLCVCLYKFPVQVFERKGIITVDAGEDIRNHVVFQLSKQKFSNVAEGILRRRSLTNVR